MAVMQEAKQYQISDLKEHERAARAKRLRQLQQILDVVVGLAVCTKKQAKLEVYAAMVEHFTDQEPEVVSLQDEGFTEPTNGSAVLVAESKSKQMEPCTPADLELMGLPEDFAAIAGDITAFVEDEGGQLQVSHQLARLGRPLNPEEINLVRLKLLERFHQVPKAKGVGRIVYKAATYIRNGSEKGLQDTIEITFGPVDSELLDQYFIEALKSGSLYYSNMQMKATECLIESGAIKSIAILPQELEQRGFSLVDLRRAPTPTLLKMVKKTIVTNVPPHDY